RPHDDPADGGCGSTPRQGGRGARQGAQEAGEGGSHMSLFRSPNGSAPRLKPLSSKRSHVVSVLDIGSTKVVCMIARLTPREASEVLPGRTHKIEIIGIGHQRSRGIKSGVISDLDALEGVIRNAVDTAERQANLTVESLIVNVSAGR